jgi:endonuclease G
MKHTLILLNFLLLPLILLSQSYDVVIKKDNYTSYFEYDYLNPTVVVYKLYKGGGSCPRTKFFFKNDMPSLKTATDQDYLKSGFDKGHMANAEDFAYDCTLDELTFRYYNCVPQNPKMNRGPWKKVETEVREWSQSKELLIVCINLFDGSFIPNTKVAVPNECIKLVYDFKTKQPIAGYIFKNSLNAEMVKMSPNDIIKVKNINIAQFIN